MAINIKKCIGALFVMSSCVTLLSKPASAEDVSYLTKAWALDHRDNLRVTDIRAYRPDYFDFRYTTRVNEEPSSSAPGHTVTPQDLDPWEAKFQFSFKTELVSPATLHLPARLWLAYTQQSHWQIFNAENSRAFRTTNYEPEAILTVDTRTLEGYWPKLVNVAYVHQSNGESDPSSRSWDRLYVQGGWEWDKLSVLARVWWRWPESASTDDNPDIERYLGYGDIVARWEPTGWGRFSLLARGGRGFMQLDWATPIPRGANLKLHLQFTSGYGETLIDYNFRQTTIGVGVSFFDW